MARVRGSLPPLQPTRSPYQPSGYVLPLYTLYSPGQVALATFLGTPVAGCWLLARNFKKLGISGLGWVMLVLGVFWTAGLCALGFADKLPGVISLGSVPAMVLVMRAVQGSELDRHTSLGGQITSWWWAVLAGIASLAIIFVLLVAGIVGYMALTESPTIEAPNGAVVAYEDGATKGDAIRLRDALTEMEYFQGDYYVGVHREGDRYVVTFAATPEGYRTAKMARAFGDLADELSRKAFSKQPVDIVIVDEELAPRRRFQFEERLQTYQADEDEVRFRNVTEEEVAEIARVLKRTGHFGNEDGKVAMVDRPTGVADGGTIRVELWMPPETEPTPLDNMTYPMWSDDMSEALEGRPIDLVLGDLDGTVYSTYRWSDRGDSPVVADDSTIIWYRDGGTLEEAHAVGEVVVERDEGKDVLYAFVMRDDNYQPARAVVAIYTDLDTEDDDSVKSFRRLAEPFSKAAFDGKPVDVRIVDDQLVVQRLLSWEDRRKGGAIRPRR